MYRRSFRRALGCAVLSAAASLALAQHAEAASSRLDVARGQLAGLNPAGPADPRALLHIVVELQPRGDLEALAARAADPAAPEHRATVSRADLEARFGRRTDGAAVADWLRRGGAADVGGSADGLVTGGIVEVAQAERLLGVRFASYADGAGHSAIGPAGPATVPVAGVRDLRGLVAATVPRLADVPTFTQFRSDWFVPSRFRDLVQAAPAGGKGERVTLIEDASDRLDLSDVAAFLAAENAPDGASAARVTVRAYASKQLASVCGRDDRGQEATLDVDAVLTLAPQADITVQDDDLCAAGVDGTLALARALDGDPSVVVLPFVAGAVHGPSAEAFGPVPLPLLAANVRGIPVVVPSGDDGAYGYRIPGIDRAGIAYPCVLSQVICAGGSQLGDRLGAIAEGPWNDRDHAAGGGISADPRPAWQDAPGPFEMTPAYVKFRIVPDLAADAAGHLRVLWHGYREGGVGGTSESAALVGATLAAIDAAAAPARRLRTTADLYVLAREHPDAFRGVSTENDRGYLDNTLRPRPSPPPKGATIIPPTPRPVLGCVGIQPAGCAVMKGFNPVGGLGDLLQKPALAALR